MISAASPETVTPNQAGGKATATAATRLMSLDAYRGLVMFLIMAEALEFGKVAAARSHSVFWHILAHHQSHVEWVGCSLHDLIQPSFSFLVGVALPFSLANRGRRGQTPGQMAWHAFTRAAILVLLGVFLRSTNHTQTYWTFEDTLSQIGFGYFFLYLLAWRPPRDQWIALSLLLIGYWAAFALYPLPGPGFDYTKVGVPQNWSHLMNGFAAHWNKNSNLAWAFDTWFLNLFPREKFFGFNDGGYATLSFIPTLGTMVLGLIAGEKLRSEQDGLAKVKWLTVAGLIGLLYGAALGWLGICPVVKRIWTPSWTLFSGGWCFLFLAAFYWVIEMRGWRRWAFPLVVIGMNSIAAYCMDHLFGDFISNNLTIHLSENAYAVLGGDFAPLVHGALALLVAWLLLFWMYRRKLFLRI